jgi:hypothetical protein
MSKERPQPPSGLAPGTREHRFNWLTTMRGYTPQQARAEFAEYEYRMNRAAWDRYHADLAEWQRQTNQDPSP